MRRTAADRRAEAARAQQITETAQGKPQTAAREGYEWVRNLMTGTWVEQEKDTPYCCRVDSERYWSM